MVDQQEALERQRELYQEKNEHLERFLEPVAPYEFYREIFPEGSFERKGHFEDRKGNGIAVTVQKVEVDKATGIALQIEGDGKAKRCTITDELDELRELQDTDFTIMSPISYFGLRRCGKNARYLYALVFDLDGVGMPQLRDTLHQMNKDILPQATFVVNSGTGLHLYYVLKEPVPMYPHNQKCLKELKYSLTRQIWNRYTSTIKEPQMQGILQGFRVVGSGSKLGREYPVRAFRLGGPVELAQLLDYIPDSNGERQRLEGLMRKSRLSLAEAKEKYPDWYERRIVKKERRGRWTVKRDLYDWWLHRIADEIRVGHRFYGIMTLAIYAKKCGIDEDELRRDAFALLRPYDDMSVEDINRFTKDDVVCALEMFNEDYVTFPRDDIAKLSGLTMPVNKRNWRKQEEHLGRARAVQAFDDPNGNWLRIVSVSCVLSIAFCNASGSRCFPSFSFSQHFQQRPSGEDVRFSPHTLHNLLSLFIKKLFPFVYFRHIPRYVCAADVFSVPLSGFSPLREPAQTSACSAMRDRFSRPARLPPWRGAWTLRADERNNA